mmetsp:Transcript_32534/g.87340  ORF Transcript_32534/g.87340 Transcript_32534/m.87340 type:complete len:210 (+) Transcript_32534:386-1015(+)
MKHKLTGANLNTSDNREHPNACSESAMPRRHHTDSFKRLSSNSPWETWATACPMAQAASSAVRQHGRNLLSPDRNPFTEAPEATEQLDDSGTFFEACANSCFESCMLCMRYPLYESPSRLPTQRATKCLSSPRLNLNKNGSAMSRSSCAALSTFPVKLKAPCDRHRVNSFQTPTEKGFSESPVTQPLNHDGGERNKITSAAPRLGATTS